MNLVDWIFIAALLIVLSLGGLLGFGKVASALFLNKFIRSIVALFVCFSFGGVILGLPFVSQMLIDLASLWAGNELLTTIHLQLIIYYAVLYFILMLLLWLIVKLFKGIAEINFLPIKIINKVAGAILLGAFALLLMLFVFQVIVLIGGETAQNFSNLLSGSTILKPLFDNNPLAELINF